MMTLFLFAKPTMDQKLNYGDVAITAAVVFLIIVLIAIFWPPKREVKE